MGLDLVLVANMLVLLKDKVVVDVVVAVVVVGAAGDDANVVVGVGVVDDGDGHLWSDL